MPKQEVRTIIISMVGLLALTIALLFGVSCAERTVVVREEVRPPGLYVASQKAVDNGKKQLSKGHCKQAIHEFNKAIEKDPTNFEAVYWLGVAEGMCGYYSRAYDRLSVAIKYSPNEGWKARVYATLGLTLLYMGREDDAVIYLERARLIDPRNEIVISYYDYDDEPKKGKKKGRIKKRPKGDEGFQIVLRWL